VLDQIENLAAGRDPRAFFDLHLRGRRGPLLDGPSPAFPEVAFIA
jgi:hypothetical protein